MGSQSNRWPHHHNRDSRTELPADSNTFTHPDGYSDGDGYSNRYPDRDSHSDSHGYTNSDTNSDTYSDTYSHTNSYGDNCTYTFTYSNPERNTDTHVSSGDYTVDEPGDRGGQLGLV